MPIMMAFKSGLEIAQKQAGNISGMEQSPGAEEAGRSSSPSALVRTIDKKARGYFKTFERSFSSSALERKPSLGEDPSAMTIEFLRARLQAQRADYRAEKQRAHQLAQKVLELECQLREVQRRKEAESEILEVYSKHDNKIFGPDNFDELDRNSEEQMEESSVVVRSECFSSLGDEDSYSDGCGGHIDGHDEGHLRVSSWESPKSVTKQSKDKRQSSKQFLSEYSSANALKNEFNNATTLKQEPCHGGTMQSSIHKENRLQELFSPTRQRTDQAAESHMFDSEQQTLDNNLEHMDMQYGLMSKPQCSTYLETEKALQTLEGKLAHQHLFASPQIPGSGVELNVARQHPLKMGSKEGLPKVISQDGIPVVTYRSEQCVEDIDALTFQGASGPILSVESSGGNGYPCRVSIESLHAKDSDQEIERVSKTLEGVTVPSPHRTEKQFPVGVSMHESGKMILKTFAQCETSEVGVEIAAGKSDKADLMETDILNEPSNVNQLPPENEDNHLHVVSGHVLRGSGISVNTIEVTKNLHKGAMKEGHPACTEISGDQGGKNIQGRPAASFARGEGVQSSFKFNALSDCSDTGNFIMCSSKDSAPLPASIDNKQGRPERQERSMEGHASEYSAERTDIIGIGGVENNSEVPRPDKETFAGEMHLGSQEYQYQPAPQSRFHNQREPLQGFISPQENFLYDQPRQSFARNTREQDHYTRVHHVDQHPSCWVDFQGSMRGFSNSTYHAPNNVITPTIFHENSHRGLYMRDSQGSDSKFVPSMLSGINASNSALRGTFGSSDRYSQQLSGGHNLLTHTSRLHDFRITEPDLYKHFEEDQFSPGAIKHQAIEPEEARYVGYLQHPYHLQMERQGRQPPYLSPLTYNRMEPDYSSAPLRTATRKHSSVLQNSVGGYAGQDMSLMSCPMSVDAGFDRVTEILKALEIAKQQVQTSNEHTMFSLHLKATNESVQEVGSEVATAQPRSPSLLSVEAGPKHVHSSSTH